MCKIWKVGDPRRKNSVASYPGSPFSPLTSHPPKSSTVYVYGNRRFGLKKFWVDGILLLSGIPQIWTRVSFIYCKNSRELSWDTLVYQRDIHVDSRWLRVDQNTVSWWFGVTQDNNVTQEIICPFALYINNFDVTHLLQATIHLFGLGLLAVSAAFCSTASDLLLDLTFISADALFVFLQMLRLYFWWFLICFPSAAIFIPLLLFFFSLAISTTAAYEEKIKLKQGIISIKRPRVYPGTTSRHPLHASFGVGFVRKSTLFWFERICLSLMTPSWIISLSLCTMTYMCFSLGGTWSAESIEMFILLFEFITAGKKLQPSLQRDWWPKAFCNQR